LRRQPSTDPAPFALDFPFRRISEAVANALPDDADVVYFQDWSALGYEALRRRMLATTVRRPSIVTVPRGASAWAQGDVVGQDSDASDSRLAQAQRFAIERSDYVVAPSRS
jgi:hypothetical protein